MFSPDPQGQTWPNTRYFQQFFKMKQTRLCVSGFLEERNKAALTFEKFCRNIKLGLNQGNENSNHKCAERLCNNKRQTKMGMFAERVPDPTATHLNSCTSCASNTHK